MKMYIGGTWNRPCTPTPSCPMKASTQRGFSMIELMIAMVVFSLVIFAAYNFMSHTVLRGARTIQKSKATNEVNHAMDRIASRLQNALSFSAAEFTLIGNVPHPQTPKQTVNAYESGITRECEPKKIEY